MPEQIRETLPHARQHDLLRPTSVEKGLIYIEQDCVDVFRYVIHWKNNELGLCTFLAIPQTPLKKRENIDKNIGCYSDRCESVLNRGRA